jgi:LL-diaminopimelate aminotransferase
MAFKVADRIQHLPPYPFVAIQAEVRRLQQAGKKVYNMNMGSPDLPAPDWVIKKLAESAALPNKHGYSGYQGTPQFRQAVARYYQKEFNVELDPETEVLPVLGSKEGLANITLALASKGDVILAPNPGYPTYEAAAILAEAEAYIMPLKEENAFLPDLKAIPAEVAQRARMMWVNYPNNPTGALATVEDYARMIAFCREYDILFMSDNPYFAVIFDGTPGTSALQVPGAKEMTVEFMSLSKSHNMAGWRLGAAVGNADAINALLTVKSNVDSGHFTPVYEAGVVALDETPQEWINERNQVYWRRACLLMDALPEIGLKINTPPRGGIYLWAQVLDGDDVGYCKSALSDALVSMVPGSIYGEVGKGYVRISLMVAETELLNAIASLKAWWASRGK